MYNIYVVLFWVSLKINFQVGLVDYPERSRRAISFAVQKDDATNAKHSAKPLKDNIKH